MIRRTTHFGKMRGFKAPFALLPPNLFPVSKEILEFVHELMEVLELAIDRGKTDIGYPVESVKFFHHLLADLGTLNLPFPLFLEMEFDAVDDLFNDIDADGSLFTGRFQAVQDLETNEGFSPAILFDNHGEGLFGPFACRKTFTAPETLPPATDRLLILALAGINDFAFRMITEWAFHLSVCCLLLSMKFFDFDSRFFQHLCSQGIGIAFFIDDSFNPCIDDHFGTDHAGVVRAVKRCPLNSHAMVGGLNDCILLGMETPAEFMSLSRRDVQLLAKAASIQAVFDTGWGSIVPRGQNLFIFHKKGTHLSSKTG
jgi:hypothetical protein